MEKDEMINKIRQIIKVEGIESMPIDRVRNIYHDLMDMIERGKESSITDFNKHFNEELLDLLYKMPDDEYKIITAYKMGFKHGCAAFRHWSDMTWKRT